MHDGNDIADFFGEMSAELKVLAINSNMSLWRTYLAWQSWSAVVGRERTTSHRVT
jgi:hypothetical protein